jgi:hypothetical protein
MSSIVACVVNIVPWWRYLLGLQTTPLNYSQAFIADYTVCITIVSITNSSHTSCVDYCAFRPLSRTTLIPVLSCAVLSYSKAGWLTDWLSRWLTDLLGSHSHLTVFFWISWPSTISVGSRLFTADSRLSLSLFSPTTTSPRNSCLKVCMCGRYSEHIASPFTHAVYEFGYWGNVRCVFHMGSYPLLRI